RVLCFAFDQDCLLLFVAVISGQIELATWAGPTWTGAPIWRTQLGLREGGHPSDPFPTLACEGRMAAVVCQDRIALLDSGDGQILAHSRGEELHNLFGLAFAVPARALLVAVVSRG